MDILVVNAGIGVFGEALELNATILIAFSKSIFMLLIMPLLSRPADARRRAHLNHRLREWRRMPVAGMAAYAASKSALQGRRAGWPVILDRVGSPLTSSSRAN